MAEIGAVGLVDTGPVVVSRQFISTQDPQPFPLVVAAATDVNQQINIDLDQVRQNSLYLIDNAFIDLSETDALAQLQVLSLSAQIRGAVRGTIARGNATTVPIATTFPKVANAALSWCFEFVPVEGNLWLNNFNFVTIRFSVNVRNVDAANPHTVNIVTGVLWRTADRTR